MSSAGGWGDDVHQPDRSERRGDTGLLAPEDTLECDGVGDPPDRGWYPPERPWAVGHTGVAAAERRKARRLAEELTDIVAPDGDGLGDCRDTDGELLDEEAGAARPGRSVAPDQGVHEDGEPAPVATDVDIGGAAASAEEAAMRIADEDVFLRAVRWTRRTDRTRRTGRGRGPRADRDLPRPRRSPQSRRRRAAAAAARAVQGGPMQQDKHPDYHPVVFRDRAAGYAFLTRSTATSDRTIEWDDGETYPVVDVEISSESHPFYTGTARTVDTEGRVARFERRYGGRDRDAGGTG